MGGKCGTCACDCNQDQNEFKTQFNPEVTNQY